MMKPILAIYGADEKTLCLDTKTNTIMMRAYNENTDNKLDKLEALKPVSMTDLMLAYKQRDMEYYNNVKFEKGTFNVSPCDCYYSCTSISAVKYLVEEDGYGVAESSISIFGNSKELSFSYSVYDNLVFSDGIQEAVRLKNRDAFETNKTTEEIDAKLSEITGLTYHMFDGESYLIKIDLVEEIKVAKKNKVRKSIDLSIFDNFTPSSMFDIKSYVERECYENNKGKNAMRREQMKGLCFKLSKEQFAVIKLMKLDDLEQFTGFAKTWDDYVSDGVLVVK